MTKCGHKYRLGTTTPFKYTTQELLSIKILIGACLKISVSKVNMSEYWQNSKIKCYGHKFTKYGSEYSFGSHD